MQGTWFIQSSSGSCVGFKIQRRENFLRCEYVVIDEKVEEIIISVMWFIIFTILTVICQAPSQTTDNRT